MVLRSKVFYLQPEMRVFRSSQSMQRGHGIGGLFRGLIHVAKPLVRKTLLNAGEKALNLGARTVRDIKVNNRTVANAIKNQLKAPQKTINKRASKRKSTSSLNSSKRKVKRRRRQQRLETVTI